MARVKGEILYGTSNYDKIMLKVQQSGQFRKAVDKNLRRTALVRSKEIVKDHLDDAVYGIATNLMHGIAGARKRVTRAQAEDPNSKTGSPVSVQIRAYGETGEYGMKKVWSQLSPRTIWAKRNYPGAGKFWQHYGSQGPDKQGRETINEIASTIRSPKVTGTSKVNSIEYRRANKKNPLSVDFTVALGIGKMEHPFDDLVRRPFIDGNFDSDSGIPLQGAAKNKRNVIVMLELGTGASESDRGGNSGIPARPWIRELASEIGSKMLKRLTTQTF